MTEGWENSTVEADLRPLVPSVPFLELRVQGSYGSRYLPFLQNPLEFTLRTESPTPTEWSVQLNEEFRLLYRCLSQPEDPVSRMVGEEIRLGEERLVVVDLRTLPPYRLVALSAELAYRTWSLGDGSSMVGRPGRRPNAVVLQAASVSRTHARFEIRDKSARLVAETESALTAVNGQRLQSEVPHDLQPNDVLQFGELLFRWEREERAFSTATGQLKLRALGRCSVSLGTARHDEVEFRNENAKNLLFWMASQRDAELSLERVLEQYWPERPPLRQRKNLSHTLKALQSELGWSEANYDRFILRGAETIRLDSAALQSFDLWDLQDGLRRSRAESLQLSALLDLHPAPLLPQSQSLWARSLRQELFLSWLAALARCSPDPSAQPRLAEILTHCLREGDFEEFVYERAFEVASRFDLGGLVKLWFTELKERLLATLGDAPSQELALQAAHFAQLKEKR